MNNEKALRSKDQKLTAWQLTDDETVGFARRSLIGDSDPVSGVVLPPDGQLCLANSREKAVCL